MPRKTITQFIKFVIIGCGNTAIDFIVLSTLLFLYPSTSSLVYLTFKTVSFVAASVNSYFWNKYWAFDASATSVAGERIKFAIVSVIGLVINVTVATVVFSLVYRAYPDAAHVVVGAIGALFGTGAGLGWNFIAYKWFVFKNVRALS